MDYCGGGGGGAKGMLAPFKIIGVGGLAPLAPLFLRLRFAFLNDIALSNWVNFERKELASRGAKFCL